MKPSEEEVERDDVLGALDGNRAAYDRLVSRHGKRVLSIAWSITKNAADAEDLAQDAFVRAWNRLGTFDPSRQFGPWICTIVSRLAIDFVRRRGRLSFHPIEQRDDLAMSGPSTDPVETDEMVSRINQAIDALPEMQRIVSRLHFVEEFSIREISEITELTEGTIRSHISHARSKLKKALEDLR